MASRRKHKFRIQRTNRSRQTRPSRKSLRKIRPKTRVPGRRKIKIRRAPVPTTARQYYSRSKSFQQTWDSVEQVVSKMRASRRSLQRAAKEIGVDPSQVIKLGGSALRKQKNGKYVARKTDRLLRVLPILKLKGKRRITTRDSVQASMLGKYWASVQRYSQTGDDSALRKFKGKHITDASGKRHILLTDLKQLDLLGRRGELSFESFYAGGL